MSKQYKYFISFQFHCNKGNSFGNIEFCSVKKINDYREVIKISNLLKKRLNFDAFVILNFILLKEIEV